jgi:hypothetical protein
VLVANSHRASTVLDERVRDGRISSIVSSFEHGKHVVRIFSGGATEYYAKGESALSDDDARAQAAMIFLGKEVQIKTPGDAVQLNSAGF